MGFLRRDDDDSENAPREADESPSPTRPRGAVRVGVAGRNPESGRDIIQRMKKEVEHGFFTSDLSVNEFLLVKEAGFDPVGLVMGSSIYHIGYPARRLEPEPGDDRADPGHVPRARAGHDPHGGGGRRSWAPTASSACAWRSSRYEWGADLAEFIAIGTAVKRRGRQLAPHAQRASRSPPTSRARTSGPCCEPGYRPVGLVMGNCVYHVAHQGMSAVAQAGGPERRDAQFHPGALRGARAGHGADAGRGDELGAEGIVGARIEERSHGWGSHIIEFFAVGTAVVSTSPDHNREADARAAAEGVSVEQAKRLELGPARRRRTRSPVGCGWCRRRSNEVDVDAGARRGRRSWPASGRAAGCRGAGRSSAAPGPAIVAGSPRRRSGGRPRRRQPRRIAVAEVDPHHQRRAGDEQRDGDRQPSHPRSTRKAWTSRCPSRARTSGPTAISGSGDGEAHRRAGARSSGGVRRPPRRASRRPGPWLEVSTSPSTRAQNARRRRSHGCRRCTSAPTAPTRRRAAAGSRDRALGGPDEQPRAGARPGRR